MQYHFAPLQGFTDAVFRETHAKHFKGIDAYYTPFCRVEKGEMRWHDQKEISPERNPNLFEQGLLVPQIIGNSAEEVTILIKKIIEMGYQRIDLNFGCPFPMIAKKEKGAGILSHPEKVKEVLEATQAFPDTTFSVKMRLGMHEPSEAELLLPILNEERLSHITMHARLGKDQYKGEMDLDAFSLFIKGSAHPVIYNGDITRIEEINATMERFPSISAIMVGRGLLQNPCLVEEALSGTAYTTTKRISKIKDFLDDLENGYAEKLNGGEGQLVQKLTSYWEYLLPELDHKSRKKILKSKKLADYKGAFMEGLRSL